MRTMDCVVAAFVFVLAGCAAPPAPPERPAQPPRPLIAAAGQVTVNGRLYRVIDTGALDPHELEPPAVAAPGCSCERWGENSDEIFNGCARRRPKTSLVSLSSSPADTFGSVSDLKGRIRGDEPQGWDMDDDFMRNDLSPRLTCAPNKARRTVERKNVSVEAHLFAASKEDDNDFHLILGDENCADTNCFINVEVSGLPRPSSASFDGIVDARQEFFTLLSGSQPGERYVQFDPPIPVLVTGSLFYDIDHSPGSVGAPCCKPDTSWEIHPVRSIQPRDP